MQTWSATPLHLTFRTLRPEAVRRAAPSSTLHLPRSDTSSLTNSGSQLRASGLDVRSAHQDAVHTREAPPPTQPGRMQLAMPTSTLWANTPCPATSAAALPPSTTASPTDSGTQPGQQATVDFASRSSPAWQLHNAMNHDSTSNCGDTTARPTSYLTSLYVHHGHADMPPTPTTPPPLLRNVRMPHTHPLVVSTSQVYPWICMGNLDPNFDLCSTTSQVWPEIETSRVESPHADGPIHGECKSLLQSPVASAGKSSLHKAHHQLYHTHHHNP